MNYEHIFRTEYIRTKCFMWKIDLFSAYTPFTHRNTYNKINKILFEHLAQMKSFVNTNSIAFKLNLLFITSFLPITYTYVHIHLCNVWSVFSIDALSTQCTMQCTVYSMFSVHGSYSTSISNRKENKTSHRKRTEQANKKMNENHWA